VSGNKVASACILINKDQAGEMPHRMKHAHTLLLRVTARVQLSFLKSIFKLQMLLALARLSHPALRNCCSHLPSYRIYICCLCILVSQSVEWL
jgi:hypothetical protein